MIKCWAVLCAALSINGMHVSSDDEIKKTSRPKCFEMKNFASKPPIQIQSQSSEKNGSEDEQELKPICFGNMNRRVTGLYSHMYTLTSIDKDAQGKSK